MSMARPIEVPRHDAEDGEDGEGGEREERDEWKGHGEDRRRLHEDAGSAAKNDYLSAKGRLQVDSPFETADLYALQKAPDFRDFEPS